METGELGIPEHLFKRGRQQVIAISGGGFRGLFSANVLASLEEDTGKRISETANLVVGTSIGGILACGIACGLEARTMCDTLKECGREIFPKIRFAKYRRLWRALYDANVLEYVLRNIFGDWANKPIANLDVPIVLTVVDEVSGSTQYISSFGHPNHRDYTVVEAAMATSAAPTYFKSRRFENSNLVDGGLGANSPETVALQLLNSHGVAFEDIVMLGIGTAGGSKSKKSALADSTGGIGWIAKYQLIDLMFSAQESISRNLAKSILREHYLLVDETPQKRIDLDDASPETSHILEDLANSAVSIARTSDIWRRWGVFTR